MVNVDYFDELAASFKREGDKGHRVSQIQGRIDTFVERSGGQIVFNGKFRVHLDSQGEFDTSFPNSSSFEPSSIEVAYELINGVYRRDQGISFLFERAMIDGRSSLVFVPSNNGGYVYRGNFYRGGRFTAS